MNKIIRGFILLLANLILLSVLIFICHFYDKVDNLKFANMVLDFYILFIAYLFIVLIVFERDFNKRKYLIMCIVGCYLLQFSSIIIYNVCDGNVELAGVILTFAVIGHICEYFISAFFVNYLLLFLKKNIAYIFYIYYGIVSLISIIFTINHLYFYLEDGYLHRGNVYFLSYIFSFTPSLVVIFMVIFNGHIDTRKKCLLAAYEFIPIIGDVLNIWLLRINYEPIFSSIALLILYISLAFERSKNIKDQKKIIEEQQQELQESKISILLSAIQPHFLYNSLTSIMSLCGENPKEAQQAIADFADYMRVNLDSLQEKKLISFEEELNHTQTYLKLQKLRFKDKINVVYNIKVSDFYLPAITIQPLVENAVKHGIFKKEEGGTVTIETDKKDDYIVIKVIDDGVGFDKIENDGRTHTGINNVKNRISIMMNGKVEIMSMKGKGTIAYIFIPLVNKNENTSA